MVTTLNSRTTARDAGYEMMQYIATRITATAAGVALQQRVGTIPSGAIITGIHQRQAVAVGSAAAVAISLGQSGTYSDLIAVLATAQTNQLLQALNTISQPLTADLDVWAQIGSGATAGDAYISVWFAKPFA